MQRDASFFLTELVAGEVIVPVIVSRTTGCFRKDFKSAGACILLHHTPAYGDRLYQFILYSVLLTLARDTTLLSLDVDAVVGQMFVHRTYT